MKLKAFILLICFFSLLNGTQAFTNYLESFFISAPTCTKNTIDNTSNEKDKSSTNTGCNKESCCSGNSLSSAYLAQHGFSYYPYADFTETPLAHVVNHYRTAYVSAVWRPPAIGLHQPNIT